MNVIKRDGSLEPFDKNKIYKAVMKAAIACDADWFDGEAIEIADDIEEMLSSATEITVEELQDLVEIDLYEIAAAPPVAKAYILYREKRRQEREKANRYKDIIKRRALAPDETNQKANANLDENSFSGRKYEASEDLWKEVGKDFLPNDIAQLFDEGLLYLHDFSQFPLGVHNCSTIDLAAVLQNGFKTRQTTLRPPSRFSTACQLVAVIFQIISQTQFGGIASGHIDRDLAPFVKKSRERIARLFPELSAERQNEVLENELKQGAEALIHNLASLQSRAGQQLPFSSLNLGADSSPDGRLVCRAILKAMIDGVGPYHTTPPFPILCFQVKKGINRNPSDPNYDLYRLAIECSTRRLTPTFVNLDCSIAHMDENDPDTWLTAMGA